MAQVKDGGGGGTGKGTWPVCWKQTHMLTAELTCDQHIDATTLPGTPNCVVASLLSLSGVSAMLTVRVGGRLAGVTT